ncbi:MAG TPA: FHA domain-containing protein, partial [Actinotalea sp.]|nr:FHA domain-containing protein [Actinotalea sp.]
GHSVSKTHFAIGVDADGVWLRDRSSTNGTIVTLADGQQILCAPEQVVRVPVGASVAFGDYFLTVTG